MRFRHSRPRRAGNVALTAAFMMVPLAVMAGIGIDFGRAYVAKAQLGQAVDAAALAGGRAIGVRDPVQAATMYFDANFGRRGRGVDVTSFAVSQSGDGQTLTVTARASLQSSFLTLAGDRWRLLPVVASATARRTSMGMELALVLDVTGSMAGNSIVQLRAASRDLLNILFGTNKTLPTLFVSVVPYTASVNFGADRTAWLARRLDAAGYAPHAWRGCVEGRLAPDDESDAPPSARPFEPFRYRSTLGQYSPQGDNDWGPLKPPTDQNSTDPRLSYTLGNDRTGPNLGCGQPVAGLTSDRDRLLQIVAALQPSSRGGTMANLGLQAGWMTLSPRWRGLWGRSAWDTNTPPGLPLDYNTPSMAKVIVMMTDGSNEWFDHAPPPVSDYTAYGRLPDGRLGVTSLAAARTELNNRMARMCQRIKAQGIQIYTVTLGPIDTATQRLYAGCASSPGSYFQSPTAADLARVFRSIGTQLTNLRLEQ